VIIGQHISLGKKRIIGGDPQEKPNIYAELFKGFFILFFREGGD